jgi:N-acyl homoserine lactone hydrolase
VLQVSPDNTQEMQLAKLGHAKSDVTLMIQSHTQINHVGHMHGFADVPIVIAAAARTLPRPLYWTGKQATEWPECEFHLVVQDITLG